MGRVTTALKEEPPMHGCRALTEEMSRVLLGVGVFVTYQKKSRRMWLLAARGDEEESNQYIGQEGGVYDVGFLRASMC